MEIVEAKVKPERMKLGDNADARRRKEKWWLWGRYTPSLFRAIEGLERVIVISRTTTQYALTLAQANRTYSANVIIFPLSTLSAFCALQSRPHEIWVRFFGSTMKDDLCYTPSDCFETFPFPEHWETDSALEAPGRAYYEFRAAYMVHSNEGLTKTYNRFHDPVERASEIVTLRELHAAMDRAVLDAYGWRDIPTDCEFLLDYEIDEEEWGDKKKPYRYRWPDEVQAEVLARLLELNAERARAEARSRTATVKKRGGRRKAKPAAGAAAAKDLFR
jgi:hypothetical protein